MIENGNEDILSKLNKYYFPKVSQYRSLSAEEETLESAMAIHDPTQRKTWLEAGILKADATQAAPISTCETQYQKLP